MKETFSFSLLKNMLIYVSLSSHTIVLLKGLKYWRVGHFQCQMLSISCFILPITRCARSNFFYPAKFGRWHLNISWQLLLLVPFSLKLQLQLVQKSFARLYFNDFLKSTRFMSNFALSIWLISFLCQPECHIIYEITSTQTPSWIHKEALTPLFWTVYVASLS